MILIISDRKGVMDLSILQETANDVKTLEQELQQLQFQMYRMQENMKDISKKQKSLASIKRKKMSGWSSLPLKVQIHVKLCSAIVKKLFADNLIFP